MRRRDFLRAAGLGAAGFAALGSAEAIGAANLAKNLKTARHKILQAESEVCRGAVVKKASGIPDAVRHHGAFNGAVRGARLRNLHKR